MISRKLTILAYVILTILFFVIPAIPGIVLWFFLSPNGFWEKYAWFVASAILYVLTFKAVKDLMESFSR